MPVRLRVKRDEWVPGTRARTGACSLVADGSRALLWRCPPDPDSAPADLLIWIYMEWSMLRRRRVDCLGVRGAGQGLALARAALSAHAACAHCCAVYGDTLLAFPLALHHSDVRLYRAAPCPTRHEPWAPVDVCHTRRPGGPSSRRSRGAPILAASRLPCQL